MYEFTLIFNAPRYDPATAKEKLLGLRDEIAKAGGEIVPRMAHGEYAIKGNLSRWKLIQIAEDNGFKLDRIYTLSG